MNPELVGVRRLPKEGKHIKIYPVLHQLFACEAFIAVCMNVNVKRWGRRATQTSR
jgi:hypothetical protein